MGSLRKWVWLGKKRSKDWALGPSVFRAWGDEKQTAKQTDNEWAVGVARKPWDYGIIRTNWGKCLKEQGVIFFVSCATDKASKIRTENWPLDLAVGKALVILTKQVLWSGGSKIRIGMDLRNRRKGMREYRQLFLRSFLPENRRMGL